MVKLSGGDKLEKALAEIGRNVDKAAFVEVGFLADSAYPDGTPTALVAAVQEFGAPARNIPPRPFFRKMIRQNSPEWPQKVAEVLKAQDYDAEKTLSLVGEALKGELQESIVDFNDVPLAPATVAKKGFDTQLIETGHMKNSVDFKVE